MILQALNEYYERKAVDPSSDIAPIGFERKPIPFLIEINSNGDFLGLRDTRESNDKGHVYLVPKSKSRAGKNSYATTFLLWDHIGYVLGQPADNEKSKRQHETWVRYLNELPDSLKSDLGISAVLKFYNYSDSISKVTEDPSWKECLKIPSCNITFKILEDTFPVTSRASVQEFQRGVTNTIENEVEVGDNTQFKGTCLVTGKQEGIARTHSDTRIGKDAKKLVGFQKNSGYDSYGKEQAYNAPVGLTAEFQYTTALNTLLKSSQRMFVGDAIAVFWSEASSELECQIANFFDEPPKDDPDRGVNAVRSLFNSIQNGSFFNDPEKTRFYILGLSPNAARISVRFWIVGTVQEMAHRIARHFQDIQIVHGPKDRDHLSIFRLLVSTATQGKSENIPPNLAGETMRSILEGRPYPQTLLQAAVRRIRSEREVSYPRASIIKACLNRFLRFHNHQQEKELLMSLDYENKNIGYRLGRLFSTLEKIQQEANPGINATIRDKFYGSASGSPVTVFGNLMRLKNHHLAKIENQGRRVNLERLLGEIISEIHDFPPHLKLEDQGRFAIGYYHQMQEFYKPKEKSE